MSEKLEWLPFFFGCDFVAVAVHKQPNNGHRMLFAAPFFTPNHTAETSHAREFGLHDVTERVRRYYLTLCAA